MDLIAAFVMNVIDYFFKFSIAMVLTAISGFAFVTILCVLKTLIKGEEC